MAVAVLLSVPLATPATTAAAAVNRSVAAVTPTASDWPTDRYDDDRTNSNSAETGLSASNVGQLHLAWSTAPQEVTNGPITGTYIANNPIVVGDDVYVACGYNLCAYDRTTGTQIWSTPVPDAGAALTGVSPTFANGLVYTAAGDDLSAYDAASGKKVWTTSFASPTEPEDSITFSPVYDNGMVFVSSSSDGVYAVDAETGNLIWNNPDGGQSELAANDGNLYTEFGILDEQSGQAVQGNAGAGWPGPAVISGDRVFVGLDQMAVAGNDDVNLPISHSYVADPNPPWHPEGPPAVANGTLYYGGQLIDGFGGWHSPDMPLEAPQLNALKLTDPSNGGFTHDWQILLPVSDDYDWAPTVANGVVYLLTSTGHIYAANATTGALLWAYSTDSADTGDLEPSPVVADGMVFVQTGNQLFAFTTDPGDSSGVPASPTQLVTSDGDGEVTLAWTEPSTAGAATSYQIRIEPSGRVARTGGTATTITGLHDWTRYTFTISGLNAAGAGPPLLSPTITPRPQVTIATTRRNGHVELYGAGRWLSLGGQATSAPSVVTVGGDPYVFVRGPDDRIWVRGTDTPWQLFGPTGTCASGPAATATGDEVIAVVCRAADNHLLVATSVLPDIGEVPHASAWTRSAMTLRGRPAVGGWANPDGDDLLIAVRPTTSNDLEFLPTNAYGARPAASVCGGSPTFADTPDGGSAAWACQLPKYAGQPRYLNVSQFDTFVDPFVGEVGLAEIDSGPVVVGVSKAGDVIAQIPAPSGGWGVQYWRGAGAAPDPVYVTIGHHAKYGAAAAATYHEP